MDLPTFYVGMAQDDYQQQLNQNLQDGLLNGVYNQQYTTDQITGLLAYTNNPVILAGTVMFNTDTSKLVVVTVQADPTAMINGSYETITST